MSVMDYLAQDRYTNETPEYTVLESITKSNTLGAIRAPTVRTNEDKWELDTDHRIFTDDIHYGLCIAKWIAERFELEVPTIDKIISWAQELRGEKLIGEGELKLDSADLNEKFVAGIPHFYGYRTVDEIVD